MYPIKHTKKKVLIDHSFYKSPMKRYRLFFSVSVSLIGVAILIESHEKITYFVSKTY